MSDSIVSGLSRELCRAVDKFRILFIFAVAAFVIMLLWVPFTDPNSGTYVIVVMNLVASAGFAVISGFFIWWCGKRKLAYRED